MRLFQSARHQRVREGSAAGFLALGLLLLGLSLAGLLAVGRGSIGPAAVVWGIIALMGACLWASRRARSAAGAHAAVGAMYALAGPGLVAAVHGLGGLATPSYAWLLLWVIGMAGLVPLSAAEGAMVFVITLAGCALSVVTGSGLGKRSKLML